MPETKALHLEIPDSLDFAALKLARDPDGHVSFDWAPIDALCMLNGLDSDIFKNGPEDNVCALIIAWYGAHRQHGGAADATADDLIREAFAEDLHGGGFSYEPGRA